MDTPFFNVSLRRIRRDLQLTIIECRKRGLNHTAAWLAEMKMGIDTVQLGKEPQSPEDKERLLSDMKNCYVDGIVEKERDNYDMARSYFDLREYDRAAHIVRSTQSPVPMFLYFYSLYMSKERKRNDNMTDREIFTESGQCRDLVDIMDIMRAMYTKRRLDGYCLYLFGVILKKLDLKELAKEKFIESINAVPTLWCSYFELIPLLENKDEIFTISIPDHWMKKIFMAHAHIELLMYDKSIKMYNDLRQHAFINSTYIVAQIGKAFHNKRRVDLAIAQFETLEDMDPCRLNDMDIYSNLLFVTEERIKMARLAHKAMEINKYRPETCCVIGNYYSIRKDHTKAIVYFQRAVKLDPTYLAAWILMGHEYIEIKNTSAAVQSYRKAIEVNGREYRAWYGLGQAYEILKMPSYSLYYYKQSVELWPFDSRMLVALGETYENLKQFANALKCFQRAYNNGDIEGTALLRLGNLYEKLADIESAVPIYIEYCKDERSIVDKVSLARAFITLGNYFEKTNRLNEASQYAYKCLEYDNTKMEAQALLNTIKNKRGQISPLPIEPESVEAIEEQFHPLDEISNISEPSTSGAGTSRPFFLSNIPSTSTMDISMADFGEDDDDSD